MAQHQLLWPELVERVQFAETAGFDGAWVFDHFTPLYGDRNGPCLEAWILLAGLAAATSRIRLGVLVTGITYRHPSILATEAITVDHVSNGRLELGLGAAWHQPEHEELGIPFPPIKERAERLEEGIQVMRLLMTKDRATFTGRHYQLANASYHPRPVQRPHPPIWIGAGGEQLMLPIVAARPTPGMPSARMIRWRASQGCSTNSRKRPDEIQKRSFARRPSRSRGRGTRYAAEPRNWARPDSAT